MRTHKVWVEGNREDSRLARQRCGGEGDRCNKRVRAQEEKRKTPNPDITRKQQEEMWHEEWAAYHECVQRLRTSYSVYSSHTCYSCRMRQTTAYLKWKEADMPDGEEPDTEEQLTTEERARYRCGFAAIPSSQSMCVAQPSLHSRNH